MSRLLSTNTPITRGVRLPGSRVQQALVALLSVGVVLRVAASAARWPTVVTNPDSWGYALYAGSDPLGDPQHPGGYSLLLALVGNLTRQVAVLTALQHLAGILTALLLFWATRRLSGSAWPALVPAAVVLLDADQIYQEQTITSEWLFTLLLAACLFASARALDAEGRSRWTFAAVAGALSGLATIVRTQGALVPAVAALAILVAHGRPYRAQLPAAAALLGCGAAVLLSYGVAKRIDTGRFELGPSPGWQLYGHVAQFADCRAFHPPQGTAGLCETTPPSRRAGDQRYLYGADSPALRLFGRLGNQDGKLMAFALAVIAHQPGDYMGSTLGVLRNYLVPSSFDHRPGAGVDIDGELAWNLHIAPAIERQTARGMQSFLRPFRLTEHPQLVSALRAVQRRVGFGATALVICCLLTVLGLWAGPRRVRVGALLFGVGGFVTLLPQAAGGAYVGRYGVPLAGPMAASAAVTLGSLRRPLRAWPR